MNKSFHGWKKEWNLFPWYTYWCIYIKQVQHLSRIMNCELYFSLYIHKLTHWTCSSRRCFSSSWMSSSEIWLIMSTSSFTPSSNSSRYSGYFSLSIPTFNSDEQKHFMVFFKFIYLKKFYIKRGESNFCCWFLCFIYIFDSLEKKMFCNLIKSFINNYHWILFIYLKSSHILEHVPHEGREEEGLS